MKLKSASLFILLCGCNNANLGDAFLAHHRSTPIAPVGRLYYKSNPVDDYFSQFDDTSPSSRPPPRRRSFLHQLDRFLTILQDTSTHLKQHTFLSGNFAPVSEEHVQVPVRVVEGQIPEGLDGAFCRNGPNPVVGWQRKRYHWFDGHAMLHTLMFNNGTATYTNQFIPCPRYQIEQELGEEYFPTIGEYKGLVGLLKLTFHPQLVKEKIDDLKQVAPPNTNVLMWNNKFYCLHEANLPMECRMYPDGTLQYLGYETFNGVLDYPVSAHPVKDGREDEDDSLIFHSYSVDEQLIEEHGTMKVGMYNSKEQTVSTYLVPTPSKKHVSFAHSIITTEHFIVVWDCSVHFQTDALFYGGSFFKSTEHSLKFGVLPKNATSRDDVIWIDSNESGAIVHPLHAWEEVTEEFQDGTLISSRTIIKLWSPFSKDLELDLNKANTFHMIEYAIDVHSKTVSREVIDDTINSEFSVMPPRARSQPVFVPSWLAVNEIQVGNETVSTTKKYSTLSYENRFGFTAILGDRGHFIGYAKWDLIRRCLDSTVYYGKNEVGGEPTVVRAANDKIYIGCYTYNEEEPQSSFIIYDGDTNEKVCRLHMPYRVPYGFHGQFIPKEDLEKHFQYHESRPSSELKDVEEEIYRRLVQQMMTMLTFP